MNRPARLAILASLAGSAGCLALFLQPGTLIDDAAITFRYVERFVAGRGLTYNDHEHVLGLSNPLYALLLSGGASLGFSAESVARALAVLLSAVVTVQVALLAEQLSGSRLGLVAGALLPLDDTFRSLMLGGMESGLAVCLGLGVVQATLHGRESSAGLLLGLAIWNKLDAALLALAFATAWTLVWRRVPIRAALVSVATVTPWWAVAWWYYSSPFPQSLSAKLVRAETTPLDPFWVATFFRTQNRELLVLIAVAAFAFWKTWPGRSRVAAATLGLWFLLHALTFSLFNLGDQYPWYLTVLIPPPLILAVSCGALALQTPARAGRLAAAIAGVAVLVPAIAWARDTAYLLRHGNPVRVSEAFESDRRLAGFFIRQFADSTEVVESSIGWVAAETPNPINDRAGLNSVVMGDDVKYVFARGTLNRGTRPPSGRPGFVQLATFNVASSVMPGFEWLTLFGSPDSKIARSATRFVQLRLFELSPPASPSAGAALNGAAITSLDLSARAPSDATFSVHAGDQPVTLVFTPIVESGVRPEDVTFSVWAQGSRVDERQPQADGRTAVPIAVRLPPVPASDPTTFSLRITAVAPVADHRMRWKDVKVVIGDARLDVSRLGDPRLMGEWMRLNPRPTP